MSSTTTLMKKKQKKRKQMPKFAKRFCMFVAAIIFWGVNLSISTPFTAYAAIQQSDTSASLPNVENQDTYLFWDTEQQWDKIVMMLQKYLENTENPQNQELVLSQTEAFIKVYTMTSVNVYKALLAAAHDGSSPKEIHALENALNSGDTQTIVDYSQQYVPESAPKYSTGNKECDELADDDFLQTVNQLSAETEQYVKASGNQDLENLASKVSVYANNALSVYYAAAPLFKENNLTKKAEEIRSLIAMLNNRDIASLQTYIPQSNPSKTASPVSSSVTGDDTGTEQFTSPDGRFTVSLNELILTSGNESHSFSLDTSGNKRDRFLNDVTDSFVIGVDWPFNMTISIYSKGTEEGVTYTTNDIMFTGNGEPGLFFSLPLSQSLYCDNMEVRFDQLPTEKSFRMSGYFKVSYGDYYREEKEAYKNMGLNSDTEILEGEIEGYFAYDTTHQVPLYLEDSNSASDYNYSDKGYSKNETKSTCPKCHGTGKVDCTFCNGTGKDSSTHYVFDDDLSSYKYEREDSCRHCLGGTQTCTNCHGTGEIWN